MNDGDRFKQWELKPSDVQDLTPAKVRDLIIECLFQAQQETFRRVKETMGKPADPEAVYKSVHDAVRLAFKQENLDFENPTPQSLHLVIQHLARLSATWGTPLDIIQHHHGQIMHLLDLLE